MRVFEKWCDENSLEIKLEMIVIEQLDKVLERFYVSACKQDGTDLSPVILKSYRLNGFLEKFGNDFTGVKLLATGMQLN